MRDLRTFTIETFAPLVGGEVFRIYVDESAHLEVQLISAQPYGERRDDRRTPFSIVFRGPPEPVLPQRTYRLKHTYLGNFELFIVPIGPDDVGMRYEAVFS